MDLTDLDLEDAKQKMKNSVRKPGIVRRLKSTITSKIILCVCTVSYVDKELLTIVQFPYQCLVPVPLFRDPVSFNHLVFHIAHCTKDLRIQSPVKKCQLDIYFLILLYLF